MLDVVPNAMAWRTAKIRGKEVWARCDDDGHLMVRSGRVEIRYRPGKSKPYHAGVGNLTVDSDGEIMPDSHCTAPEADPRGSSGSSKKRSAKKPSVTPPSQPSGDEVLAYCDGACSGNPGPAGLGAVMLWSEERRELSEFVGEGTNNIAELMAILRVAEAMSDPKRPLRLYTDSSYSIGVLTKGWKAKANKPLIAEVKAALSKLEDAELIHVRGHAGIDLNERADELARQAVSSRDSTGWVDA